MKKSTLFFTLMLTLNLSLSGCSTHKTVNASSRPDELTDTAASSEKLPIIKKESSVNLSPYTGEAVDPDTAKKIPFMAIVENSKDARPQSGLSEADVVYETMAEGGIPRFIALFQKNSPKIIGPIRSARSYFINISKEYNLAFSHCGGSEEAINSIKDEKLMSLNEMNFSSSYWRDNSRKAPHNLYTSAEKLRSLIVFKGYNQKATSTLHFDKTYWTNPALSSASLVNMKLNKYYTTSYELKNGQYYKKMDNVPSIDKANENPISVSNIVIQITNISLQTDGKHLDIDLIGSGDGYVISCGKYVKMHWKRDNIISQTILTDELGKSLPLSPGKTWWHIVDKNCLTELK